MFTSFSLFVSSYSVLFALVGLRLDEGPVKIIAFLAAGYGLLVALFVVFITPRSLGVGPMRTIVASEDRGGEVAGYLVGYILPFLMAPKPSVGEIVQYLLFLAVVGVIYARSSLWYINPTFYVLSKRVQAVKFDASEQHWTPLLTGRDLRIGDHVKVRALTARFVVELKQDQVRSGE